KKSQDRERNRLHARNTRARKKQYVEELQHQLEILSAEQDAAAAKHDTAMNEVMERQDAWRHVVRKVFDLRAEACLDENKWGEVLCEDFLLTLPVTPYRSFSPSDMVNNRCVRLGISGMIADTQSLAVACDNIGFKTLDKESRVDIEYLIGSDRNRAFYSDDGFMCTFLMRTTNAMEHGALVEVEKSGMIRTRF
ncbi:unnamed protein product, partial [Choristocarpus tenellus]